jgi:DNA-binding NtrC family response regulator
MITGYKSASKIMISQNIQEDGFLEKPFQLEEVEKLVNRLLGDSR